MQLNQLSISRNTYGWDMGGVTAGGIGGKISFSDPNKHEVTLMLTPGQIDKILSIVADSMVQTTRELAETLTANIIQHAAQIPQLALEA